MSSSRYLGKIEITQLLVSGMTNILSEFSMSSDIRVVQVCRSYRKISMMCECLNGPKQANRMCISNKMLKFVLSTYIAHRKRVFLYELIIRLSGRIGSNAAAGIWYDEYTDRMKHVVRY